MTGLLAFAAVDAASAPAARTTLDGTIEQVQGEPFSSLEHGPGEPYIVRSGGFVEAKQGRVRRRNSLAYFSQLTDPQIADEMSPLRVEKTDPVGGDFTAAWRPQEAAGTQVLDQIVHSVNANGRSPLSSTERRARLGFAILTGDQPDNQQLNEVDWYLDVLEGKRVSPFSGQPISATNPCGEADPAERAALNAKVAAREYTGVQDYDDWPGRAPARYQGFWDPEQAPGGGPYAAFPRYEGLMDRAQDSFDAEGLTVPFYTTRGNHDGLVQGNIPANSTFLTGLVTSCSKFFPSDEFVPSQIPQDAGTDIFSDPAILASLVTGAELVPPDPDRRFLSKIEYKQMHEGADHAHGFGYVGGKQLSASDGNASYYSFEPAKGVRFIGLDTVAEGGGAAGNLDDPQYRWLENQLDRWTSVEYRRNGKLRRTGGKNKLIVLYGHHTLETMNNPTPDEDAGPCADPPLPGCDGDPRDSQPIHLGQKGPESLESLLLRYPNVIAIVTGHTHHNAVSVHRASGPKRGFWELNTSSHVDFPQQSRLIEIMNNRDGTLSIFGTMVDQAGPIDPPPVGSDLSGASNRQLAALSRTLAANDPQRNSVTEGGGTGTRRDRNVELMLKNPRRLAK